MEIAYYQYRANITPSVLESIHKATRANSYIKNFLKGGDVYKPVEDEDYESVNLLSYDDTSIFGELI